ncbi:MAG: response regulator [Deltaproteobacteria bacterium]|nr:response regulator [Deltaproteobacteria bacterium]
MERIEKVLVVDDDEGVLRAMRRGLERAQKVVDIASNRTDAHRIARRLVPDLAIIDFRLCGHSGIDVLRELRAVHTGLRAVLISGYLTIDLTVDAVKAGAELVFAKPVTASDILIRAESNRGFEFHLEETPSLARVQYEHIVRVVADCGGNISKAARRLGLHRQSLQRRLRSPAPTQ